MTSLLMEREVINLQGLARAVVVITMNYMSINLCTVVHLT